MEWLLWFLAMVVIVWLWLSWQLPKSSVQAEPKINKTQQQLRHSLNFVKSRKNQLISKQKQQDEQERIQQAKLKEQQLKQAAWEAQYAGQQVASLDSLTGIEFEQFLATLFERQGYSVHFTPVSGDFGADLLLEKDGEKIAVQAKRYSGTVGVDAIQEVVAAKAHYKCQQAWVVTTSNFTHNAKSLAKSNRVVLINRHGLGKMML